MTVQKKGITLRNQNNVFQWTGKTKRKLYKSIICILNNQRDIAFKKVEQAAIRRGFLETSRNENHKIQIKYYNGDMQTIGSLFQKSAEKKEKD